MTTLRVELVAGFQILSCESCGWCGSKTGAHCIICGRAFNRVRFVKEDGREVDYPKGSDEKGP